MPVRIFLSHSSHAPAREAGTAADKAADAAAEALALKRLHDVEALLAAQYEVLLDEKWIRSGDEWRRYIQQALEDCDAGVLFVSEWALASKWVRYEATMLTLRARDPRFKFLPVLLPGTNRAKLKQGDWEILDLSALRLLKTGDAKEIADEVAAFVGQPDSSSPLDRMCEDIAVLLGSIDEKILRRACGELQIKSPWDFRTAAKERLAAIMARRVLRDDSGGLSEPVSVLKTLYPHLTQSVATKILDPIEPLWVPPLAASTLELAATKERPELTDVALNGWEVAAFTAEQYVRRARPRAGDSRIARVVDANAAARVEHVKRELRAWVRGNDPVYAKRDDTAVDVRIKNIKDLFVLLPFVPTAAEMTDLRAVYGSATFICSIIGGPPTPVELPHGMVLLEPPLENEDIETNAYNAVSDARQFVTKLPPP